MMSFVGSVERPEHYQVCSIPFEEGALPARVRCVVRSFGDCRPYFVDRSQTAIVDVGYPPREALFSLSSRNPFLRAGQTFLQGPDLPLKIQLVLAAVAAEP